MAVELATGALNNAAITYRLLGHTAKGAGDLATARQHYQAALDLFTRIGSPSAKGVQADLASLDEAEIPDN